MLLPLLNILVCFCLVIECIFHHCVSKCHIIPWIQTLKIHSVRSNFRALSLNLNIFWILFAALLSAISVFVWRENQPAGQWNFQSVSEDRSEPKVRQKWRRIQLMSSTERIHRWWELSSRVFEYERVKHAYEFSLGLLRLYFLFILCMLVVRSELVRGDVGPLASCQLASLAMCSELYLCRVFLTESGFFLLCFIQTPLTASTHLYLWLCFYELIFSRSHSVYCYCCYYYVIFCSNLTLILLCSLYVAISFLELLQILLCWSNV